VRRRVLRAIKRRVLLAPEDAQVMAACGSTAGAFSFGRFA
jgi:hypothetical protein